MLELELNEAVKKFVKTFRVVRLRHLKHFFSDWDVGTYEHTMKYMQERQILHKQADDIVSVVYPEKLHSPLVAYNGTLRCLDALTGILKSSEVVWFDTADYPLDVRFLTVEDELYDLTYLDASNWVHKCSLLPIAWKNCVPLGQEDPFNHIAVVPSLDVAQNVRDMPFTQFIVVHGNGGILGIYDND